MDREVSQGSVLEHILWNIEYDVVLRDLRLLNTEVVCYADNTLVLVGGTGFAAISRSMEVAVSIFRHLCM